MAGLRDSTLAERDEELLTAERAIAATRDGLHQLILVEGAAGIGKTRLLSELRRLTTSAGLRTLTARASEIERSFAFGAVRQLFEPHLVALDRDQRGCLLAGHASAAARPLGLDRRRQRPEAAAVEYAAFNGLYWLCANLAHEQPLALLIDDAHWADDATLKWLAFAAARLHDTPVLIVLAARTDEPESDARILADLGCLDHAETVSLWPLSLQAVADLLEETAGERPSPGFARSCHEATGGNPFLLDELIRQLNWRRIELTDDSACLVPQLGSRRMAQAVLSRVQRFGTAAVGFTRAAAVVGDGGHLLDAAELAGLDQERAVAAAGHLADAGILAPDRELSFAHPLVRAAIDDHIPRAERDALHGGAARLLADRQAGSQSVAAHLLRAPPAGEPWVVDQLRAAASEACAQGSPGDAVRCLRRTLVEPLSDEVSAEVLTELGSAEHHAGEDGAIEHLATALERARGPSRRAAVGLVLARAMWTAGRIPEAVSLLEQLVDSLDEQLAEPLEAELIAIARLHPKTRAVGLKRSAHLDTTRRPANRLLLANIAFDQLVTGQQSAHEIASLAEQAVGDGCFLDEYGSENTIFHLAAWALAQADQFKAAERALQAALALARTDGSIVGFARSLNFLADLHFRQGRIRDAAADARASLDHLTPVRAPLAIAFLLDVLIERDELDEADQMLEQYGLASDVPPTILATFVLERRARLRLAQARPDDALADALLCEQRSRDWGAECPAFLPWRSTNALALHRTGDISRARALAAEEVAKARAFGARRALGAALHVRALLADRTDAMALLDDAVGVLRRSDAALELARALADLGTALNSAGEREAARDKLRQALHLAEDCGAIALARRARIELRAAGGRPTEPLSHGLDALSPAEFRVATMAADGMTNRDIAQALFLTPKTIEWHLGQVYRKLGLRSRTQLAGVLKEQPRRERIQVVTTPGGVR